MKTVYMIVFGSTDGNEDVANVHANSVSEAVSIYTNEHPTDKIFSVLNTNTNEETIFEN